jgi:hypothetical protein
MLLLIRLKNLRIGTELCPNGRGQDSPAVFCFSADERLHRHHEAIARLDCRRVRLGWASPAGAARAPGLRDDGVAYNMVPPQTRPSPTSALPAPGIVSYGGFRSCPTGKPPRLHAFDVGGDCLRFLLLGRCIHLGLLLRQLAGVHDHKPQYLLAVERCRDWEKLSELFRRHRSQNLITTERSAQFLQWRYGPGSPNHPSDIYLFRDQLGNEGWFALGKMIRGRYQGQVRGCVLLDAIWPRGKMSFRDILPAILQLVPSEADAIFFRSRPGLDYGKCSRLIVPRRLDAPSVWAMTRKGSARLQVSALDLVIADGDSAWVDTILDDLDHFWPTNGRT